MGNYKTLESEHQREQLLRVCDNFTQVVPLLWHIKSMRRWNDVCNWLIQNNLTGRNLYDFWLKEHNKSILGVMQTINKHLEKADQVRAIRLGRDVL